MVCLFSSSQRSHCVACCLVYKVGKLHASHFNIYMFVRSAYMHIQTRVYIYAFIWLPFLHSSSSNQTHYLCFPQLNIAYPTNGTQMCIDVDDEHKVRPFYEKRMAAELPVDFLGDEWKGYVARITGGNDKQGFPMKQGVLTNGRVRLLLKKGHSCYRPRRKGERKRKSVRGCIVDSNLSVLNLVVVRKGEGDIPGLTDQVIPRRLGPKRASKIRKLFNLSKEDNVCQFVVRKPLPAKEGKSSRFC